MAKKTADLSRTGSGAAAKKKRPRRTTLFPASSFEEALTLANAIQKHAAGQKVRRLTLLDQMQKSPDSSATRQLIVNSNKYGLTKGSYVAEHLELTPDGKLATGSDVAPRDRLKARFKLAFNGVPPFKALYEAQKGNRLPATSVLEDLAREQGIPESDIKECVEMFIVNAKFLGVLKPIAGAERIVPVEQVLEELPAKIEESTPARDKDSTATEREPREAKGGGDAHDSDKTCLTFRRLVTKTQSIESTPICSWVDR